MQRTLKCPKCRTACARPSSKPQRNPSSICIADYKSDGRFSNLNENEYKLRIWSYMKPPRISEPIPSVNPERLEMVRDMLDGRSRTGPTKVHIDSNLNIELLPDGSIRKTTSRIEKRTYASKSGSTLEKELRDSTQISPNFSFKMKDLMSSTRH